MDWINTYQVKEDVIKVIIADDHPIFRVGLRNNLENDNRFKLVGQAANGKQLLEIVKSKEVDVVLTDIQMPEMDGIEAIKILRKKYPKIKILVISNYGDPVFLDKLTDIDTGAHGYLLKLADENEILYAIRKVHEVGTFFSSEVQELIKEYKKELQKLNDGEIEVIQYIVEGLTNNEIAGKIFRTVHCVNGRIKSIYAKTGCSNQRELVAFAIRKGLDSSIRI